jgi:hypothetical protein
LLLGSLAYGQQDSGTIRTFVEPEKGYRVKLNGNLQPEGNAFKVKYGRYHLEVWAPGYFPADTTFVITNAYARVVKVLKPTPRLVAFNEKERVYDGYKKRIIMSTVFTGFLSAVAVYNYNRIGDLNLEQISYENGVKYGITGYTQSGLDEANGSLSGARALQVGIYAGIAAGASYAVYNYVKMKKYGKPKFEADRSFLVDGIGVSVIPGNRGTVNARFRF